MKYMQYQLEKDWEFAQELLNRMGLGEFKVSYQPNDIRWLFWNRELDDYCIKKYFDDLVHFNHKMDIDWDKDRVETFQDKLEPIKDILKFLGKDLNYTNIENVFHSFCGSSHTCEDFSKWLHKNREYAGIE